MKAKRVKSLVALLLVLAMMLPTLPFSYADPPTQPKMLSKEIIGDPDSDGNYTIELTVEDTGQPQKHDVVIVFDVSLSMKADGANKFIQAKNGAKSFAKALLKGDLSKVNRIAVVSFADKVYVNRNFTNNITEIENTIDSLDLYEHTNIHAGLHEAGELLKNSKADHKQILLLSDGGPDACYDLKRDVNGTYFSYLDFQKAAPGSDAKKKYERDYESKALLAKERMNYGRLVKNGEVFNSTMGQVWLEDDELGLAMVDPTNQAYSEAKFLKDSAVTIRVIGYEVDAKTKAILQQIASSNSFYQAEAAQIDELLAGIGENFAKYKNVKVKDPIGEFFDLVGDPVAKSFNGQGTTTVEVSSDRRLITWTIGELKGKATLTYKVKLKANYHEAQNNTNSLLTNGPTGFEYDGGSNSFPIPEVPIHKVTYKSLLSPMQTKVYNYLIKEDVTIKSLDEVGFVNPEGRIFQGWKEEGTNTLIQPGKKINDLNKSYVFIAQWKKDPNVLADVTARAIGEGKVNPGPVTVKLGETTWGSIKGKFNATPNSADYILEKWYIEKDGKEYKALTDNAYKFSKEDCAAEGNIYVVAKFKKNPSSWVTITAKSNDTSLGTVTGDPLEVKKSTTWGEILDKNHFKTVYDSTIVKLKGWKIDGQPDTDLLTRETRIDKSVTVVAVFQKLKDVTVKVEVDPANSGTIKPLMSINTKEGKHWRDLKDNFKIQEPKPGYEFKGFYLQKPYENTNKVTDDTKFDESKTIYAHFAPKTINVTGVVKYEEGELIYDNPNGITNNYKGPALVKWKDIKGKFKVKAKPGYKFSEWAIRTSVSGPNQLTDDYVFTKDTSVYAEFKALDKVKVEVTINGYGQIDPMSMDVFEGTKWGSIKNKFSKDPAPGYKFNGWTLEGGGELKDTHEFKAPTKIVANFVKDDGQWFNISGEAKENGSVTGGPVSVAPKTKWSAIKEKFKATPNTGYKFNNKWTLADGTEVNDDTEFTKATTVYAIFDKDDAQWIHVNAVAKEHGKMIKAGPVSVLKNTEWSAIKNSFSYEIDPGYKYDKWTLDDGTEVKDNTKFTVDTTVYVNFVKDDSQWFDVSAAAKENGSVTGGPVSVAPKTKWSAIKDKFAATPNSGYVFNDNWTLADGTEVKDDTEFTEATTVYANFTKNDAVWFDVTAEAKEHGTVTGGPVSVAPDTLWSAIKGKFTATPDPGYVFNDKWTLTDGTEVKDDTVFNKATTVYAHFTKDDDQYTFINAKVYNNTGGTVSPDKVEVLKIDKYSAAIAKIKDVKAQGGYVFHGDWVDATGKLIDKNAQVKENDTIYAKFLKDTGEFITVRAVSGPNGSVTGDPIEVVKGTAWKVINPDPPGTPRFTASPATGYKFINWTLPNGNVVAPETTFNENTTVTANFVKNEEEYIQVNAKIYLDEGGSLNSDREEFLKTDTYAKLPSKFTVTPLKGYAHTGWVDKDGKTLDPTKTMTDEETVYAKLERLSGYWIRINAKVIGEGEVDPENAQILKEATWADIQNVPKPVFKTTPKKGHRLVRWAIDEQGTKEIEATQTFVDGSVVYAVFEKQDDAFMNIMAEAFPPQGGTATPQLNEVLKGTKWSEIRKDYEAVAAPGYIFDGWYIKDKNQKLPTVEDDSALVPDYSFEEAEVVIQARFKEDDDKWIHVTARSKGNGQAIGGTVKVLKDSIWDDIDKHFTVKPDSGYRFSGWTNNKGDKLVDSYVFSVTQEIYANFALIPPPPAKPQDDPNNNPGGGGGYGGGGYGGGGYGGGGGGGTGGGTGSTGGTGGTGGSGGGGGQTPPEETTIDEDDVAKGILNYNDFYAYIQGYPDGSVRSGRYVNREETAAIFFRLLDPTYKETIRSMKNNFKDISASTWSNKHISTLANGGIIKGYSDGTFRPRAAITRAELAVIAAKFDRVNGNMSHNFTDVKGHWAEKYIANASTKGWIKGYPNGQFKPDTPITRAEFVTFVNKVLGRNVKKAEIPKGVRRFTDLKPDAWYYENMVTATNSYLANRGNDGFQKWSKLVNMFIEM